MNPDPAPLRERVARRMVAATVIIVLLWQVAILLARRSPETAALDPTRFKNFRLQLGAEPTQPVELAFDDAQVNLLVHHALLPAPDPKHAPARAIIRLVHGFNVRDCMRIKGYRVTALTHAATNRSIELWEMVSPGGETSVWATALIRADDFSLVHKSVTELAFPRVGIPDDQTWEFHGLSRDSLRHPIRNFSNLVREKWNSARADLLTFLKVKPSARPSSSLLTLIVVATPLQQTPFSTLPSQLNDVVREIVNALPDNLTPPGSEGVRPTP